MKGLIISIYDNCEFGRDNMSVLPKHVTSLTLVGVGVPEIFEPTEERPIATLVYRPAPNLVHVIPGNNPIGLMRGASLVSTSDSRFGKLIEELTGYPFFGGLPLFDRREN